MNRVVFIGDWAAGDLRLTRMTVAAAEEYLGEQMPTLWRLAREGDEYTLSQVSLFREPARAATVSDLLELIRSRALEISESRAPITRGE